MDIYNLNVYETHPIEVKIKTNGQTKTTEDMGPLMFKRKLKYGVLSTLVRWLLLGGETLSKL